MGTPAVAICVLAWMLALFGVPWVLMLSGGLLYGVVVRVVVFVSVRSDGTRVGVTVVVAIRVIVVVAVAVFVGMVLWVTGIAWVVSITVFNVVPGFIGICVCMVFCGVVLMFCRLFFEIYAGARVRKTGARVDVDTVACATC